MTPEVSRSDAYTRRRRGAGWAITAFVVALAAIIARAPHFLTEPRVYAEEGRIFLSRAFAGLSLWSPRWADVGYLDTVPILAAMTATHVTGIESSPFIFMWASVGVTMFCLWTWVTSPLIRELPGWKLTALAICLAAPGPFDDFWVCTLYCKYYLVTVPLLILAESAAGLRRRSEFQAQFVLVLSAMGSGLTVFIAPLAVAFPSLFANRVHRKRALLLLAIAAIHLVYIYLARRTAEHYSPASRFDAANPIIAAHNWFVGVLVGALAPDLAHGFTRWFAPQDSRWVVIHALEWTIALVTCGWLWLKRRTVGTYLLTGSFVLVLAAAGFGLGEGVELAPRYLIASRLLLVFGCAISTTSHAERKRTVAAAILLAITFQSLLAIVAKPIERKGFPLWRDEVAAWRLDPRRPLHHPPTDWYSILYEYKNRPGRLDLIEVPGSRLQLVAIGNAIVDSKFAASVVGAPPNTPGVVLISLSAPTEVADFPGIPGARSVMPHPPAIVMKLPITTDDFGTFEYEGYPFDTTHSGVDLVVQIVLETEPPTWTNAVYIQVGNS